ncbi:uncharacterized protein LOC143033037 [Oratosquilla oratoria]|uniref:uncharacterized protein LOC143033037 n=1 Tax=Oratosquilla oratoria TaxID=337810 RepID=UPI003F7625E3
MISSSRRSSSRPLVMLLILVFVAAHLAHAFSFPYLLPPEYDRSGPIRPFDNSNEFLFPLHSDDEDGVVLPSVSGGHHPPVSFGHDWLSDRQQYPVRNQEIRALPRKRYLGIEIPDYIASKNLGSLKQRMMASGR